MQQGYLTVRAFSAQKIIPVKNTTVIISQKGNNDNVFLTDDSGLTPLILFPTPNIEASEQPSDLTPFSTVTITAKLDGFFTTIVRNAQIFPDRITIQEINMIPVTDYLKNSTIEIETTPQNL